MYGYIYFTENLINLKCYIGKREKPIFDEHYIGSGKHLKSAIKKYGKENFVCQPIQWCETKEELLEAERTWISKCKAVITDMFYNLKPGGEGGNGGACKGRTLSDEHKKKVSDALKGKPKEGHAQTEETRKKISDSQKGHPNYREGLPGAMTGHKHSEETKKKLSEAHKGKTSPRKGVKLSEETKKKLSEVNKGRIPWNKGMKFS